jgi:hypothetical protein
MGENRKAPRRRVLKAATLEFGGGAIDCTVRNISHTGAALEVFTPLFIPERLVLSIPKDQFKRRCRVVRRAERRLGVVFESN